MKHALALVCGVVSAVALAGPLDERKAEEHLKAIAAGNVEAVMTDYAENVYMDWIGGPLDGRYNGKAAVREVWTKFFAANDGQPRPVRRGKLASYANPKGASLETEAEYGGKTPVKVRHVLVYRDAVLNTEIWQIAPAIKLSD